MIKIKNLEISYGDKKIVKGIDLTLKKNSITAIVGESGTGKTSIGLSILGMNKGDISGSIYFNDKDILMFNKKEMKNYKWNDASMVFQNTGEVLNPVIKVIDLVAESMIEHKIYSKNEAYLESQKILLKVGLDETVHNLFPTTLSGGQKQKLLIAIALANNPKVLIFDEPTSALDAVTKIQILNLIKEISKDKIVLIITHSFFVVKNIAKELVILYGGRILEKGCAKKIMNNPKHPYTRALLRSSPNSMMTKDLQGIKGNLNNSLVGCPFANRCTQCLDICFKEIPKFKNIDGQSVACHRNGIICLLKGEKIKKKYQKKDILHDIDFELYEGETLSIIGESGSGKTTLAKCIMGMEVVDEGSISFKEKKNNYKDISFYREVQMIFQNPQQAMNKRYNIYQTLKEPLDIHNIGSKEDKRQMINSVLKEVKLDNSNEFLSRYPDELSGGECQRLAIARSIILKPKLLIADEITAALDGSVQAKIMKLLMHLQENRGLSIIFITHNIALAKKVSDKIMVIKNGKIIESGCASKVFNTPKQLYTKQLIDAQM